VNALAVDVMHMSKPASGANKQWPTWFKHCTIEYFP